MTASNFEASLGFTLVYEGGWVNNPKDPGGATYRGITQAVYDDDRDRRKLPRQTVHLMTDAEMRSIYLSRYWAWICADSLPSGADYAVFDFAVNSGVARAVRALQHVIGATEDGQFGPLTLGTAIRYAETYGASALSDAVCSERMAFLKALPTFGTFGAGWTRRVIGAQPGHQLGDSGVIDRSYAMSMGNAVLAPTNVTTTVKTYNAAGLVA